MSPTGAPPAWKPEEFFVGHPDGLAAFWRVRAVLEELGEFEVRISKSQVAFRRRRGFAYLWLPGRWIAHPQVEVVLSFALDHPIHSDRFKEVAHPNPTTWMHHLEVGSLDDLDSEVDRWLAEAWARAGESSQPSPRRNTHPA